MVGACSVESVQRVIVETLKNNETWKAIREYWDGSRNENGNSGCGIVITAIDREKLDHTQENVCPVKVSTAMEAEVAGVTILTEVPGMMLGQRMNVEMVTQCIERVTDEKTKAQ